LSFNDNYNKLTAINKDTSGSLLITESQNVP